MFKSRYRMNPLFVEEEIHFRRKRPRLRLRFLLALLLTLLVTSWLMVHKAQALPTEEPGAGQLLLSSVDGKAQDTALMLDSTVHFDVSGMVAHVRVEQRFFNDSQNWVEGVYVFPLPETSAVHHMRMEIGDRIIEGKIAERAVAEKRYQEAKAAGKRTGLVRQQRSNMFTTKVANIAPYETVSVTIEYVQTVAYDQGRFSLRFPMTITPRYIPGTPLSLKVQGEKILTDRFGDDGLEAETAIKSPVVTAMGWAVNTDLVPDASEITPFLNPLAATEQRIINPITITARLNAGMPLSEIESTYHRITYHRITTRKQGDHYELQLSDGSVSMDRDFVLNWQPVVGQSPRAALFSEQISSEKIDSENVDGEHYGLLMVVPPIISSGSLGITNQPQALPKESIYIIDKSGSMGGVSIRQARESLLFALEQLAPIDRFNVIAFSSNTEKLFAQAVPANQQNLAVARRYVSALQAGGGTEMRAALDAALINDAEEKQHRDETYVRQIIFITDGAVGNESALFKMIHERLGNSRLFTVGIGSAPNSYFMRKAAEFGRGSFTHIGDQSEVSRKMQALLTKLESPVATAIQIDWPSQQGLEVYPERIPDLYRGEPLLVAVKLSDIRGEITVRGRLAGQPWQQQIQVDQVQQHRGVATLWARQKIASLLDQKTAGAKEATVRQAVLDVALTHQLLSPYTSFIAIEDVVSRPVGESINSKSVLNARPHGQSPQRFAYPKTAAGISLSLVWGIAFLAMFCLFACRMRASELCREEIDGHAA